MAKISVPEEPANSETPQGEATDLDELAQRFAEMRDDAYVALDTTGDITLVPGYYVVCDIRTDAWRARSITAASGAWRVYFAQRGQRLVNTNDGTFPSVDPVAATQEEINEQVINLRRSRLVKNRNRFSRPLRSAIVVGVFLYLIRLIAVAAHGGANQEETLNRAWAIAAASGPIDSLRVLVLSGIQSPVYSLLLAAVIVFWLQDLDLPTFYIGTDLLPWGPVVSVVAIVVFWFGALGLAPWPVKPLVVVGTLVTVWGLSHHRALHWRFRRMGKRARRHVIDPGETELRRDIAGQTNEVTRAGAQQIIRDGDEALNADSLNARYSVALAMGAGLAVGYDPDHSTERDRFERRMRWVSRREGARRVIEAVSIPICAVVLFVPIAANPRPWEPPVCVHANKSVYRGYVLSDPPLAVLQDDDRTVKTYGPGEAVKLSAGGC